MITAQDVRSGYGQKIEKSHIFVLPYLRAQVSEKEKAAALPKNTKSEQEKATDKNDKAGLDQYDKARLEILRG